MRASPARVVVLPLSTPLSAGDWALSALSTAVSATVFANGDLRLSPFLVPGVRTDQLALEVVTTAGGVGSVHRIVVYADSGAFFPGELLYDSGAILDTSTLGLKTDAPGTPLVMPAPCWVSAIQQGAPAPNATLRSTLGPGPYQLKSPAGTFTSIIAVPGYSLSGVTGAPPAAFPTAGFGRASNVPLIGVRQS